MKKIYFFLLIFSFLISSIHAQTFTNVALQVGINSTYFDEYYVPGGGVGFADYDNDGDPDLIIASRTHFKVYRNDNGFFTDVTSQSGINMIGDCLKSVIWGDYNNDGWRDVYLTSWYSGNRLYKNNGNGTFSDITSSAGVGVPINYQSTTAAWGDVNKDGFIDLYVCNYGNIEGAGDQLNILYKNNGNGTFSDITSQAGVADSVLKKPLAVVIYDYNMDGWQDIYISMDKYQRSTMFKNLGNGTFQDVTWQTGTMCFFDAMGIGVGDYNHDGWLDMHVSNGPPGNATFRYNGNGTFTDVAVPTNTTINKECWGNGFIDYDNDGWCDLYVTASAGIDMCDVLYRNN
ncbi:MAG: VCBS repeat-containing protein, partial [Chlorobi bacterium]|nr:VCBS repeat-containing protein [Chlorobiota bacterium]